jgi:hypothetical protein
MMTFCEIKILIWFFCLDQKKNIILHKKLGLSLCNENHFFATQSKQTLIMNENELNIFVNLMIEPSFFIYKNK